MTHEAPRVAAIILAAGRSRRMAGKDKLLLPVQGKAMVLHVVDAALKSRASAVILVVGGDAPSLREVLGDRPVSIVENADADRGMASSLARGVAAVPVEMDGFLVCLADMPLLRAHHLDHLMAAFDPPKGAGIIVPLREGRRGNPVLFDRRYAAEILAITGDRGARSMLEAHAGDVLEVPMPDAAVLVDVDRPEDLNNLEG